MNSSGLELLDGKGDGVILVGIDWSEHHQDVCVVDEKGTQLARVRVPEGVEGVVKLHEAIADHADAPDEVIVGIEIYRGCSWVPWSLPATKCSPSTRCR